MNICVVGTGYVGLVTGAVFADLGNDVVCVDNDQKKIDALRAGQMPIYEPGLDSYVERNQRDGRLSFTTDVGWAVGEADVVFIAVGTPPDEDGSADLRHVLGTGLRLETPIGPLRLEYGHKLDREDEESSGELFLAIGSPF